MSPISDIQRKPLATLAVVTFALFMDYFLYGMLAPLASVCPAHVEGESALGITYGAYAAGVFLSTPVLGFITDRVGRKKIMIVGVCCQIMTALLFGHGNFFWELVAARFFQGVASACTWTAGLALLAESFKDDRVKAIGIAMIGSTAGSVAGPAVAGALHSFGGYSLPFIVAGVLLVCDIAMRALLLAPHPGLKEDMQDMRHVIFDRAVLSAAFAVALSGASWAMMEPLVPSHIRRMPGGSPASVGILFTTSTIIYGFCAPIVAKTSDRIGVPKTICFGLILSAIALPLLSLASSVWATGAVLCLVSIAYAFTLNPTSAELADAVDRKGLDCYALAYAIYNLAYSAGMMCSDSFITMSAERLTLLQMLGITSFLFICCIPMFMPRKAAPVAVVSNPEGAEQ